MNDTVRQYYSKLYDYDALSSEEKNSFLTTRGLQNRSYNDVTRIYKNSKFKEEFGTRPDYNRLKLLSPYERDMMLQQSAINKTREKFFTEDQIGVDRATKIGALTQQGFDDLINSDWDPDDYIHTPDMATTVSVSTSIGTAFGAALGAIGGLAVGGAGAVPGAAAGASLGTKVGFWGGTGLGLINSAIETYWNADTDSELGEIVARDNNRKSEIASEILPEVSEGLNAVINGSAFRDQDSKQKAAPIIRALSNYGVDINKGDASNIDTLFEKVVGKSTPYWEMFKDRHELSDITTGDKLAMIQKTLATDLTFQDGGYSSASINNQSIQDHVSNNQGWDDWAFNTGKNLVVGTVGALGETVAGTAALGAYAIDKTTGLVGEGTNYAKNILEGVDENGNEMPILLNLAYFDGVDKFNTFNGDLIKKIRENGGISPYNNVALAGEEGRFFSWQSLNEAIKMGKYALATRLTSGILGYASNGAARVTSSTMRKLGASAMKSETVGTFVNKFGSIGTYLAAGVPVSAGYGLGAYEDTKLNLTQKEDERQARELFDNYLKTEEYKNRVAEIEKQLLTPRKDDNGNVYNIYSKEGAREAAEAQIQSEMAEYFSNFVKNNREALEEANPSFKENRKNIDRIAVDAYALDATIEGAKNTFVNLNFRSYLFNKSTTEMLKGGKDMTTPVRFNPKTGKIEQVSKGIRGENIPSNVKVDIARAVGNQLWGGFISNYTDDVTTGFVEAGAEKRYDNYLEQRYNGKAAGSVANFFGNLYDVANASLQGAEAKTRDQMSWYDGFIGALGSVTPGSGGLPTLSPYNSSNSERAPGSKLVERLVRTSGIGATAYDTYYKHRNTSEEVDIINKILDSRALDLLDLLDFASATNAADISIEDGTIRDAKTDRAKAFLTSLLYLDRNKDNPVVNAAPQLQKTLRALEVMRSKDGLNSEEGKVLVSELATQFLQQEQNKDIAALPKSEAMNTAISKVSERLEKASKLVNSMDEASAEYRMQNRKASSDAIGQMVTLKVMADQYRERISEMEEELGLPPGSSLSGALSVESILARYPKRKLMEERLATIESFERHIKELQDLEDTREEENKKTKDKEKTSNSKARSEWRKAALKRFQDKLLIEKALIQKTLEQYASDTEISNRILTKEEILALDPDSRIAMLSTEENSDLYSPEQRQIIRDLRTEYTNNGVTNALEMLLDISHLTNMYNNNLEVYSDNIKHPELLENNILDKADLFSKMIKNVKLDRQSSVLKQNIDKLIIDLTNDNTPQDEISNSVFRLLKERAPSEVLKYMQDKEEFNNLEGEIERVLEFNSLINDIGRIAQGINLDEPIKNNFIHIIDSIIDKADTKENILDELGKIIESSEVNASDKIPYENLLNSLEELWNQRASTTSMTREERIAAQKKLEKERAEEEKRKKDAEEAARAEAEKREVDKASIETTSTEEDERLSSERKSVEDTLEQTSDEEDKRLSSERETVEGTLETTSKEENDRLSSEKETVKNTPGAIDNATDVQLESPTLEEQVATASDKVSVIPVPVDDSTDKGNLLSKTSGTLLGNAMYGYELDPLKIHSKQVPRKSADPNDKMGRYFAWMEAAGIKLQDIIDNELSDIMKLNPDVFPMFVKFDKNATNDDAMVDFVLLTVEYTQDVADIHNDKNGGVITSDGKQYLVVGTLGFARGNRAQGDMFRSILKSEQKSWFDAHPSERFFVDTRKHTQIQSITSGRLVRQLATDSEVQIRSISELLTDETRNPKGLTIGDLKWGIQYDNRLATVNVSERNVVYPPSDSASNLGSVFLLVEAANGNYIPAYIRPVRYSEINDGELKREIDDIFNRLTSTNLAERIKAWKELRQVVDCRKDGNWVLYGDETHNTVTVQVNGVRRPTHDLESPNFDRDQLLTELKEADFRINITTSALSTEESLNKLDEAGALTTDLAKIGTSGASYNVYAMDADGNPIITAPVESKVPTLEASSDLAKAQKKLNSERVGNVTYRKDTNGNWYTETDKLVTDQVLIEQLNYRNLIRTRDLKPDETIGMDEVFIVNSDKDNPLVLVRRKGSYVFAMSKEGAVKTINEVNAKLTEKARQERLQKELEKEASNDETISNMSEEEKKRVAAEGEDVNLGLDETITEEQIMEQMTGNFETGTTSQQKPAEDVATTKDNESPAIQSEPIKTGEDINKTGTKSLAELQSEKTVNTALSIIRSRKYGKKARELLRAKFPDMPRETAELERFLQSKHISTTGIPDVEKWLHMIEECK